MNSYALIAMVLAAMGEVTEAVEWLQRARQMASGCGVPRFTGAIDSYQARLWLAQGEVRTALRWARQCLASSSLRDGVSRPEYNKETTIAQALIAGGEFGEAILLLDRLLRFAEASGRNWTVIRLLALKALASAARGEKESALATLRVALQMGAGETFARAFLDAGDQMRELLANVLRQETKERHPDANHIPRDYLMHLLDAFGPSGARQALGPSANHRNRPPLLEPLRRRELQVLQLISLGKSDKEVAAELFLGVSTIRTHVKNVFGKLAVHNRTEAAQRARELGLI